MAMVLFTGTTWKVLMKLFSLILLGRKCQNECHVISVFCVLNLFCFWGVLIVFDRE